MVRGKKHTAEQIVNSLRQVPTSDRRCEIYAQIASPSNRALVKPATLHDHRKVLAALCQK